jgi:poly-beta-hydroxyalkanoate depolymerase
MVWGRYSELLEQRKEAKLQWLQDPTEVNRNNLNNVRLEASRYFTNKKREYPKGKINVLATNSENKNIKTCIGKNINLSGTTNSEVIYRRMRMVICLQIATTFFSHLLNAHNVSDVRQIEIYSAELLVLNSNLFYVETVIKKLKRYKLPGSEQIKARGKTKNAVFWDVTL